MITIEPHIKGLIFDWDGTLIDTMPLHYLAWQETVQTMGAHIPEELFYELAGVPSDKIVEIVNEKYGYQLEPQETAAEKERLFRESYLPRAKPIEPILAIAKEHKGKLPMAVATGGIPAVIQPALKVVGLETFFDAIVTSEDVANGKPAPDTFLEAARRLNVDPENCMVFEDSDLGLEAATRAGMIGVDVRLWIK